LLKLGRTFTSKEFIRINPTGTHTDNAYPLWDYQLTGDTP